MACTLSNKCAKNLSKWTVLLQLIIKKCGHMFFLEHSLYIVCFAIFMPLPDQTAWRGEAVRSQSVRLSVTKLVNTTRYFTRSSAIADKPRDAVL